MAAGPAAIDRATGTAHRLVNGVGSATTPATPTPTRPRIHPPAANELFPRLHGEVRQDLRALNADVQELGERVTRVEVRITEHTIWTDDMWDEVYRWATERHKNRVKAADDRRPAVEGDTEDSYAIAAQANRNRRERVEVETRTRADLLKVCREARFTLLMLTPEDFTLLADVYAMKPATDAAERAGRTGHLDGVQTRHYEDLFVALRAGKRTAILSWITRTRAVDWDAEVQRAIALDKANEATKNTPATITAAAKMPDISAEQADLPLTGTYEKPEIGPGLDPVEMRMDAACEAAEELGWETSDNGRTWHNPRLPAAVLEMVVEGNAFKMIPAKTTSTTTQPIDPIPQATAPAEPQRGVQPCDNSREQEATIHHDRQDVQPVPRTPPAARRHHLRALRRIESTGQRQRRTPRGGSATPLPWRRLEGKSLLRRSSTTDRRGRRPARRRRVSRRCSRRRPPRPTSSSVRRLHRSGSSSRPWRPVSRTIRC